MASLTPLSKGLIGLAVVGAMASAAWHLALKERFGATATSPTTGTVTPSVSEPSAANPSSQPKPADTPAAVDNSDLTPTEHAEHGRKLLESGDFVQARKHLEWAVQGGDAGAACHLGEMTLKGQGGIATSQEAAAKLFQLAQSRNTICFAPGQ